MSDSVVVRPSTARKILAAKGPVTPDKLRAADMYAAMSVQEPGWPWWLVADLAAVVAMLVAPLPAARAAVVMYVIAYVISLLRLAQKPDAARVIVTANPDAAKTVKSGGYAAVGVVVVLFSVAGLLMVLAPQTAMRVVGAIFGLFIVRHTYRRISAHVYAQRVLAAAPELDWYPQYVADRALREAHAAVALDPQG